jgi:hypothetical protein
MHPLPEINVRTVELLVMVEQIMRKGGEEIGITGMSVL